MIFRLIKQLFIALLSFSESLANMVNVSDFVTCISLNNQLCMSRPTPINFIPNQHNQGLSYYSFMVNLDRCNGSCNTLDDPSGRI